MLLISYQELINKSNEISSEANQINSCYSIVIAVSKRARQINNGADILVKLKDYRNIKPVSIAMQELYEGKIKINV